MRGQKMYCSGTSRPLSSSLFMRLGQLGLSIAAPVAVALFLVGCAASLDRNAVPLELADKVDVPAVGNVRHWGDEPLKDAEKLAKTRYEQIKALRPHLLANQAPNFDLLAISGGGADGAYGAGLLSGWTKRGDRPQFEIVAGVSTGALSAPFAFLGPQYDRQLTEIYTEYATDDLITQQVLAGLIGGGSAVTSTKPLEALIKKYMNQQVLSEIAQEHKKGRRLLVGTTNLDSERPVVWDMGAIASQGTPQSGQLFRRILLASAALPGLFPPVFLKVQSDGRTFQEMHVDGGTTDNAFLLPAGFDRSRHERKKARGGKHRIFIIANSKLAPDRQVVEATTFAIAGRSIATLIKQQLQGDLLKIYLRAKRNKIAFNLTSIPPSFQEKSSEPFDKAYMKKLYDVGFAIGVSGDGWSSEPSEF
ncbi:MAG: patatin-like phospholipase family protein [Pseudomonadota bacterium]